MKNTLLPFLLCLFFTSAFSKPVVNIEIEYENYENDTLLVAYHFGEKILILDTLYAKSKHKFVLQKDEALEPGMYLLVAKPNNTFFQFLINEEDQEFKIKTDYNKKSKTEIKGSEENEDFYKYIKYLSGQRSQLAEIDTLVAHGKYNDSVGKTKKEKLAKEVEIYQKSLIEKYHDLVLSIIISANMAFELPDFEGTDKDKEIQKYQYYRQHYLDGLDLSNPATLRTPFLHKKVTFYMDNLTPINADSINQTIDFILNEMKPAETTFQYYLSHFLNTYSNSKYIGLDGVYVYLSLQYYNKGLAPWVKEENLEEIISNAKSMEPTLIGKIAPDFTTLTEQGDEFTLSQFQAEYTVLIFWAPDCGHCTKAMPYLVDFQEKYKDDGVKVVSICNQVGKKYETCWTGIKEKKMMTFLNTGDQYMKSRVTSKYFVKSTPLILLMDKNKKIILKKIPAENIDNIMANVLEVDAKKKEDLKNSKG
ncbi:MAG: redoxin domain-containing protein [Saprospiraceae bacterium]